MRRVRDEAAHFSRSKTARRQNRLGIGARGIGGHEDELDFHPELRCLGFRIAATNLWLLKVKLLNAGRKFVPVSLPPRTEFELCLIASAPQNKSLYFCLTLIPARRCLQNQLRWPSDLCRKGYLSARKLSLWSHPFANAANEGVLKGLELLFGAVQ